MLSGGEALENYALCNAIRQQCPHLTWAVSRLTRAGRDYVTALLFLRDFDRGLITRPQFHPHVGSCP